VKEKIGTFAYNLQICLFQIQSYQFHSVSNGIYLDGNDTEMVLDNIKNKLNEIDKTEFETNKFVDYRQRFQFFLSLSLFFLIADVFLFETKTKWIQKLNLFNEK
jgi:Ca-activated chloride channel family protein